jgi:prepilin-type N-terminal cleavage/methylation domain-containing protein
MLKNFSSPRGGHFYIRSGFTLMEMMIAIVAGLVILGSVVVTTITLSRSMVAISNYYDLDSSSRNTLDVMSRDIRNADQLTSYATNAISMSGTNYLGSAYSFTYNWDGSNMWRTYTISNSTRTWLMLSNCAYLAFSNYTRVPQSNFTFSAVSGTNRTKLLSVSWKCSRSILGAKLNTESVQTAKIVIRN